VIKDQKVLLDHLAQLVVPEYVAQLVHKDWRARLVHWVLLVVKGQEGQWVAKGLLEGLDHRDQEENVEKEVSQVQWDPLDLKVQLDRKDQEAHQEIEDLLDLKARQG